MESSDGLHSSVVVANDHQQTAVAAAEDVVPDPSSLPIRIHRSYPAADITVQCFTDRLVITCSQRQGKIGSWLYCKPSSAGGSGLYASKSDDWEVTHLLGSGREDPFGAVFCRRIAHLLSLEEGFPVRPLLLGLAINHHSNDGSDRDLFTSLVDLVVPTVLAQGR
jgi:hypothetical protein